MIHRPRPILLAPSGAIPNLHLSARLTVMGIGGLLATAGVVAMVHQLGVVVVVAVVVAIAIACTMFVRPQIAIILTVAALYVNVPAILHKYHGVPEVFAGAFVLALGIPVLHDVVLRRERLRADASLWLMILFLAVLLLSAQGSRDIAIAMNYIRRYLLEGVLIYWLVTNVVRTLPGLKRVLWTVLTSAALLGGLALYQELTNNFDQEFGGLAHRNYSAPMDEEPNVVLKRQTSDRAQGPLNEPNRFAQILLVLLPFAVFAAKTTPRRVLRLYAVVAGGLIVAGVLLTLSRGAIVTLVAVTLVAAAIRWIRPTYVLGAAVILIALAPLLTPFLVQRVQSIAAASALVANDPAAQGTPDGAIRGRAAAMLTALQVFRDHPILGVGPGQYTPFYSANYQSSSGETYRDMQRTLRAHIMYFEVAAETGLVGLTVFLGIVGVLIRRLWLARRRAPQLSPELAHLATACLLALACYLFTAVFLHLSYQRYYWFLLALCSSAVELMRSHAPPSAMRAQTMVTHG